MKKFIVPMLALLAFWASAAYADPVPKQLTVAYTKEIAGPETLIHMSFKPKDFALMREFGEWTLDYYEDSPTNAGDNRFATPEEAIAYYQSDYELHFNNAFDLAYPGQYEIAEDVILVDYAVRQMMDETALTVWAMQDEIEEKADTGDLPPPPSFTSGVSRSIVTGTGATGFQISESRNAIACYTAATTTTATIGGASSASVFLEVAPTNSATAGDWIGASRLVNSQTITLAIILQSVQGNNGQVCGYIPAGYYAKIRSAGSGTNAISYISGWELLL